MISYSSYDTQHWQYVTDQYGNRKVGLHHVIYRLLIGDAEFALLELDGPPARGGIFTAYK